MLDCNGFSPTQRPQRHDPSCADIRGFNGERAEDNEHYIGHDEPSVRFLSKQPGSANNVTWTETLPREPRRLPTVSQPGRDVTHTFELSVAPWYSMALCNSASYPLLACVPRSDSNAPASFMPGPGQFPGGGSSFLEVQFYPPGYAPFIDNISCDNTHWCASLHINDLECTVAGNCNDNCIEPTNFAFIQTNGVPTGPPSPQLANVRSFTPNRHTLLMNQGDRIRTHIFDAAIKGGHALRVRIDDLTTGRSGFMTASAANGYMATSIADCSGTPFNYEPEYSTATQLHLVPWAALEGGILTEFEIGHFEPCTSVTGRSVLTQGRFRDVFWNNCHGPYETDTVADGTQHNPEVSDAFCYRRGDTHGGMVPPNLVTGCLQVLQQNGDLDFDGTSYRPDWPSSLTPNRHPSPSLQLQPTTVGGATYPRLQIETNAPASEVTTCSPDNLQGCAVPPPSAPTPFYPWWTHANVGGKCVWEFGQMTNGNTFGRTAQYGPPDLKYYFGNLISPVMPNRPC